MGMVVLHWIRFKTVQLRPFLSLVAMMMEPSFMERNVVALTSENSKILLTVTVVQQVLSTEVAPVICTLKPRLLDVFLLQLQIPIPNGQYFLKPKGVSNLND